MKFFIPLDPANPLHEHFSGIIGTGEADILPELMKGRREELEGADPNAFVGTIVASRGRPGLDFTTLSTFDPSKWQRSCEELRIAFQEELLRLGLVTEDELDEL